MTLTKRETLSAIRHICDAVIRSATLGNSFFLKTVLVSSNAPGVVRRDHWTDQHTDDQQVQNWQTLKASDEHGHYDIDEYSKKKMKRNIVSGII